MLDLNQTPEQIADSLKQAFKEYAHGTTFHVLTGDPYTDNEMWDKNATACAILCVENMLKVCQKRYLGLNGMRPNPDYLKLSRALQILKIGC